MKTYPLQVVWEPYEEVQAQQLALSNECFNECFANEDMYTMTCPLICFYAVKYHLAHRVARQFGLRQDWPVPPFSTSVELHK